MSSAPYGGGRCSPEWKKVIQVNVFGVARKYPFILSGRFGGNAGLFFVVKQQSVSCGSREVQGSASKEPAVVVNVVNIPESRI
jgi:hypothetical protein